VLACVCVNMRTARMTLHKVTTRNTIYIIKHQATDARTAAVARDTGYRKPFTCTCKL
jgi:hypothetical protein